MKKLVIDRTLHLGILAVIVLLLSTVSLAQDAPEFPDLVDGLNQACSLNGEQILDQKWVVVNSDGGTLTDPAAVNAQGGALTQLLGDELIARGTPPDLIDASIPVGTTAYVLIVDGFEGAPVDEFGLTHGDMVLQVAENAVDSWNAALTPPTRPQPNVGTPPATDDQDDLTIEGEIDFTISGEINLIVEGQFNLTINRPDDPPVDDPTDPTDPPVATSPNLTIEVIPVNIAPAPSADTVITAISQVADAILEGDPDAVIVLNMSFVFVACDLEVPVTDEQAIMLPIREFYERYYADEGVTSLIGFFAGELPEIIREDPGLGSGLFSIIGPVDGFDGEIDPELDDIVQQYLDITEYGDCNETAEAVRFCTLASTRLADPGELVSLHRATIEQVGDLDGELTALFLEFYASDHFFSVDQPGSSLDVRIEAMQTLLETAGVGNGEALAEALLDEQGDELSPIATLVASTLLRRALSTPSEAFNPLQNWFDDLAKLEISAIPVSSAGNFAGIVPHPPGSWPTVISVSGNTANALEAGGGVITGWDVSNAGEVMATAAWHLINGVDAAGEASVEIYVAGTSFSSPLASVLAAIVESSDECTPSTMQNMTDKPFDNMYHLDAMLGGCGF